MEQNGHISGLERQMDEILAQLEKESNDENLALSAFYSVESKLGMYSLSSRLRKVARWSQRVCAILFIPAAVAVAVLAMKDNTPEEIRWAEVNVPLGQTRQITLPDSTLLTLNGGSRVTYPDRFGENSREVFFDGEVFAQVTKDSEHPFIIHNNGLDLKVFGTTFDFKSYTNSLITEVILVDGSVTLDIDNDGVTRSVEMTPGDLVQFNREKNTIDVKAYDIADYKSFNENHSLYYFNLPIKEIAKDLERVFGVKIVILNEKLAEENYLALFSNNESLDDILTSFRNSGRIKARRADGVIYLDKR